MLSRQHQPTGQRRIALAHSGLLEELGRALPLQVVGEPPLRVEQSEASAASAPLEGTPEPPPKLKVVGTRRRHTKPSRADDEPDGAA